jgi:surface protein
MKNLILLFVLLLGSILITHPADAQKIGVFGVNTYGQFGDGTTSTTSNYTTVTIMGTDSNWTAIGCGYYHSLALKTDGTLWAWGRNNKGQLGDGTIADKNVPTQVGAATNWKQFDGGEAFTVAVQTDGTLWAWGDNSQGQLGDGTTVDQTSPIQIGTDTDWVQVDCGAAFVIAIKADSTLWAWGNNAQGQLGNGNTTSLNTPTQIGTEHTWWKVAAHSTLSTALKTDGSWWEWGALTGGVGSIPAQLVGLYLRPYVNISVCEELIGAVTADRNYIQAGNYYWNVTSKKCLQCKAEGIFDPSFNDQVVQIATFSPPAAKAFPTCVGNDAMAVTAMGELWRFNKCAGANWIAFSQISSDLSLGKVVAGSEHFLVLQGTNPTIAGTIGSDQSIASNTTPAAFTNVTSPSGETGTLEYQWQKSTTSNSAGFGVISGATSITFTETVALTQTTWYKRMTKVTNQADWLASNVVKVTIQPLTVPMQLKFTTTADGQSIRLPLYGTVNCTVDWGDGTATQDFTTYGKKYHAYETAGTYTVTISGTLTQFGFYDAGNSAGWEGAGYLTEVVDFGSVGLTSLYGAFSDADNLSSVPASLPSTVTSLSFCFVKVNKATITNLNLWNVSSVTDMSYMFNKASSFNQPIGNWNVGSVTSMNRMFRDAAAFNQPLGNWTVSNVTDMSAMFRGALAFNQPLADWDVSSATDMSNLFDGASSFNQPIGDWDVSSVTDMSAMFDHVPFNQDISNWDVSSVTDMSWMFNGASAFDRSLDDWDMSSVTAMEDMFKDVTLSTINYDSILTAWAAQPVQSNVVFNGGNSTYSAGAAATARGVLTGATNNWSITDGGQVFTVTTEAASAITATTATGNGTIVSVGSGNASNRGVICYPFTGTDKIIGDAGVTNVIEEPGPFVAGAFTASLTGLSVNARYNARAHATNTGDGTKYGDKVDFWTLANVPDAPTVNNPTATTLDVTINVNGNPESTEFAIHVTTTAKSPVGKFVQEDKTLDNTIFWATAADWGTITVTGLTTGTTYTFEVKARNGGNTETAYGTTASGTPVAAPVVTTQAASAITSTTATGNGNITATNGINPTVRGIIYWPYNNTDQIIDDANVTDVPENGTPDFGTGAFTGSLSELSVNTRYNARAYASNTNGTGYGSRVDFWTLANVPSAPTVNNPTATSLDVTINVNGNPESTEFAIHVTTTAKSPVGKFVQNDGTLGNTIFWATATTWGTKTVIGLITGTTYTFEVKARNGVSTETAYGASTSQVTCSNPTNAGSIENAQTICYGTTPDPITSTAAASNFGGTIEYMWQFSNSGEASGFNNIDNSNTEGYAPAALTTTTWYKRLARVTCKTDWIGAAETNVVKITVRPQFTAGEIDGTHQIVYYPFTTDENYTEISPLLANSTLDFSLLYEHYVSGDGFGEVLQTYPDDNIINAAAALENNIYFTLTLDAVSTIKLDSLIFEVGKGGSSDPRGFFIRSSIDSYATDLYSETLPSGSQTAPVLHSLALGDDFQDISSVTFRFYIFSPGSSRSVDWRHLRLKYQKGESICNNGDPAEIGSTTLASGGAGTIAYQWQSSLDAAFTTPTDINSSTPTYDPPAGLAATTWYRRQAKDETCNTSWNTSTGVWKVTTISPTPILTGNENVTQGQVVTYSTPYNPGNTYTWNASHGNPELCFPYRNCLTLTWDFPCGVINPGYVRVTETNTSTGCSTTVTKWITIAP